MQAQRDKEIVEWIGRVGAVGVEHVMRRLGVSRTGAYAPLRRLVAGGLLAQRHLLYRQAGLYVATKAGLRWCGLEGLRVFRVGAAGFVHTRQVATTMVELEARLPGWRVLTERELRMLEAGEERLLGSARVGELPDGRPMLHRPDLLLLSPQGRAAAVEVELSLKARRELARICRGWARARHIQAVYYLAAPDPARSVGRVAAEVRAQERIVVLGVEEAGRLATIESGQVPGGTFVG